MMFFRLRRLAIEAITSEKLNQLPELPMIQDLADAFLIPSAVLSKAATLEDLSKDTYKDPREVLVIYQNCS